MQNLRQLSGRVSGYCLFCEFVLSDLNGSFKVSLCLPGVPLLPVKPSRLVEHPHIRQLINGEARPLLGDVREMPERLVQQLGGSSHVTEFFSRAAQPTQRIGQKRLILGQLRELTVQRPRQLDRFFEPLRRLLLQQIALDLVGRGAREVVQDLDIARHLEEGDALLLEEPFGGPHGSLSIDYDFYGDTPVQLVRAEVENERLPKELFFIPALLLLAGLVLIQRPRATQPAF